MPLSLLTTDAAPGRAGARKVSAGEGARRAARQPPCVRRFVSGGQASDDTVADVPATSEPEVPIWRPHHTTSEPTATIATAMPMT